MNQREQLKKQLISQLINHARGEVGYHEGRNNRTKYASEYFNNSKNYQNQPWCDTFIDSMMIKTFGKQDAEKMIGGFSPYTPTSRTNYIKMGNWHDARENYIPQPGDQIFFKFKRNDNPVNHTGIVVKVENGIVHTIEGNTRSGKKSSEGDVVSRHHYPLNSKYIVGYGTPNWDIAIDRALKNGVRPDAVNPSVAAPPTTPKPSKQSGQTQNELLLLQTALQSGISSRTELANLMAQCAHESMGFKRMDESFKYSKGIDYIKNICESTKRFPDNQLEAARQEALSGNPQKLAEMMYGSRPDLGNIHPGDGFKFHGRGFVQLTGRANYEAAGKALGLDLTNNPDLAAKPEHAAKIAVWYWQHNIVSKGIQENVRETGIAFNGGNNGLDSRQKSFENLFQKLTPEYVAKVAAHTPQRTEPERQTKPNASAPALAEPAALTALNAINNKLDILLKAHESGNQNAFRQQVCEMAQHRDAGQMMARASAEAQHERVEQQQNSRQQETLQQENAQQQGKTMRR